MLRMGRSKQPHYLRAERLFNYDYGVDMSFFDLIQLQARRVNKMSATRRGFAVRGLAKFCAYFHKNIKNKTKSLTLGKILFKHPL